MQKIVYFVILVNIGSTENGIPEKVKAGGGGGLRLRNFKWYKRNRIECAISRG